MKIKICKRCGKEKSIKDFNKNSAKKDGLQVYCKICDRKIGRDYYKKNWKQQILLSRQRNKERRKRIKSFLINEKNKPCVDCGKKYPYYIMDFDHIKGTKKGNISRLVYEKSLKFIKEEIKKCDVVCANCHRIRTYKATFV